MRLSRWSFDVESDEETAEQLLSHSFNTSSDKQEETANRSSLTESCCNSSSNSLHVFVRDDLSTLRLLLKVVKSSMFKLQSPVTVAKCCVYCPLDICLHGSSITLVGYPGKLHPTTNSKSQI
uniref:Uncharacterized protein n=1 Tax=Cacopsylla melanoneura TaxID=428564 RepID=A0A8D8YKT6_9HEMI